ncbi:MAG TPA: hypothetical protein DCR93_03995 [Cytophagales bacterium]|nr:hypothetical protein [Cytophagales bacterium]HAP58695.1 hypothetical protein [Cytophagales bacterium]
MPLFWNINNIVDQTKVDAYQKIRINNLSSLSFLNCQVAINQRIAYPFQKNPLLKATMHA